MQWEAQCQQNNVSCGKFFSIAPGGRGSLSITPRIASLVGVPLKRLMAQQAAIPAVLMKAKSRHPIFQIVKNGPCRRFG